MFPDETQQPSADSQIEASYPQRPEKSNKKQSEMALEIEKYPLGIIGEVETVRLPDFKSSFEARVDTGATTCSIDAFDIKNFERDGRKWVSFKIKSRTSGEQKSFELPVVRIVPIKRHGAAPEAFFCDVEHKNGTSDARARVYATDRSRLTIKSYYRNS
ncbi:MAG: RimK/LysX family protein [Bacilli bacterium]